MGQGVGGVSLQVEVGGDGLGGCEVEPVGEDAEVPEQTLFMVGEQSVGPFDRLSEGAGVAQQIERAVEPVVEVSELER